MLGTARREDHTRSLEGAGLGHRSLRVSVQQGFYSNTTFLPGGTTLGTDSWFPYSFKSMSNQRADPVNYLSLFKGKCSLKASVMLQQLH